ncbi:MAG: hypothetical protein P4L84_04410 [Isosphaeraceae bacterium]|nr:hypothetical protein [Isosphaeraceae bacterium]
MSRFRWLIVGALLSAGCAGADDELPRQPVGGKVTLDGLPLAKGQIVFNPATADAGTRTGGPIVDGSYRLTKAEGPVPGRYNVIITSASAVEGDPDDQAKKFKPTREPIAPKYNARTALHVEIKADATNELDFPLTSR